MFNSLRKSTTSFIKSPFPYAGCKYKLLPELGQVIPSADLFVDLFGGSGVVAVNMAHKFKKVVYNDIMSPLVYMHRNMQTDSLDTILQYAKNYSSKVPEEYVSLRDTYNKLIITGGDREIGYRFFGLMLSCTNNLVRFNRKGGFNQTCGKRQLTGLKVAEIIEWKNALDGMSHIVFNNQSFETYADLPDGSVVYADPPYSNTEAGYNEGWDKDEELARFILSHPNYRWIISSCIRDGRTTNLVDILISSGQFHEKQVTCIYKASKKTRDSDTSEIILCSR